VAVIVRRFERRGPRRALREVVALDEFHHEGGQAPAFFEAVDRGDVRMVQRREGLGFTLEASQAIRIVRERLGQNLDRDIAVQLGIAGAKDFAHAPAADQVDQLKDADAGARSEAQTAGSIAVTGAWTRLVLQHGQG
jgi:hypothetical protein